MKKKVRKKTLNETSLLKAISRNVIIFGTLYSAMLLTILYILISLKG